MLRAKWKKWDILDTAIEREGWKLLLLLRLSPMVPYNLLNIAMATTKMHFVTFTVVSAFGRLHPLNPEPSVMSSMDLEEISPLLTVGIISSSYCIPSMWFLRPVPVTATALLPPAACSAELYNNQWHCLICAGNSSRQSSTNSVPCCQ